MRFLAIYLALFLFSFANGLLLSATRTWNGLVEVDGGWQTLHFNFTEFDETQVIVDASIEIVWTKTAGTCSSPTSGYTFVDGTCNLCLF